MTKILPSLTIVTLLVQSSTQNLIYEFDCHVKAFANVSKTIHFKGVFDLTVNEQMGGNIFSISFLNLSTKLDHDKGEVARKRKAPPNLKVDDPLTKHLHHSEHENRWYPLSTEPLKFKRLRNGTISKILISQLDFGIISLSCFFLIKCN